MMGKDLVMFLGEENREIEWLVALLSSKCDELGVDMYCALSVKEHALFDTHLDKNKALSVVRNIETGSQTISMRQVKK